MKNFLKFYQKKQIEVINTLNLASSDAISKKRNTQTNINGFSEDERIISERKSQFGNNSSFKSIQNVINSLNPNDH
jgi:hypothetical protein